MLEIRYKSRFLVAMAHGTINNYCAEYFRHRPIKGIFQRGPSCRLPPFLTAGGHDEQDSVLALCDGFYRCVDQDI
jgi:hypothetical protein